MKLVIYMLINSINGKIYIGKTKRYLSNRLADHRYFAKKGSESPISRAIAKYGYENFEIVILEQCDSEEALNQREFDWIMQKHSTNKKIGYNVIFSLQNHVVEESNGKERIGKLKISSQGRKSGTSKFSKYVGVRLWDKRWYCQISLEGKLHSKVCVSEEQAAKLYDKLALAGYGENAKINFECDRSKYMEEDLDIVLKVFLNKEKTSKTEGVSFDKSRNKWVASKIENGTKLLFKRFQTEEEAANCKREFDKNR